jgi:AAA family ATP:ADP antiporter
MITGFLSKYYGVSREELKKFVFLGAIFAFTIGIYWMLRPLKDSLFCALCSSTKIPYAKFVSLAVVIPLAMGYSMIVDRYPRHRIFYALCTIYGSLALMFAYFFAHPVYGLDQANIVKYVEGGKNLTIHKEFLSQMLGWAWYVYVESFGSLMVVLFWGFAADTTTPDSAKRGFGIVAMGAQVGGICGPLAVTTYVAVLGEATLTFGAAIATFLMGLMIFAFMKTTPKEQLEGYKSKDDGKVKVKTGFMEGAKLLISQPYLLGIFSIISIFEIINTIFDFKLKMLASSIYTGRALSEYLSHFGMWVNIIGLICLVLGISNIGRKLGVRKSLLILPSLVTVGVFFVYFNSTLAVIWAVNAAVKALNYAFNQPIKEQLYIPTSKDTKYKAKAWTEMFGSRGSKAAGSGVNVLADMLQANAFLLISSIASLGLIGLWVLAAMYVGTKHKQAIDTDSVVC